jgi:copper(I)-binding protein
MRKIILAAALLAAGGAHAQTPSPAITVENVWARATAASAKTGALYLTIIDHGAPDRLTGITTPVADKAELHQTTMQDNIMRMRPVDGLAVTASAPVKLAPGGYHVMLMGLKQQLKPGQSFPVTLTFAPAVPVQAAATVAAAGATGMSHSGTGGHMMDMSMPMPPAK